MKTLEEIFQRVDLSLQIDDLKKQPKYNKTWAELEDDFVPSKHPIKADPTLRPKDKIKKGQKEVSARLTYAAEKIATRRMTQMAFSIPVRRDYNYTEDENEKAFQKAIESVYKNVRINGVNSKRMYAYFACCEVATFWYAVEGNETTDRYGFNSPIKYRCRSFSSMPTKYSKITQANLYPYFDENDDMVALSVEYVDTLADSKTVTHFDCFMADRVLYYTKVDGKWSVEIKDNPCGKIQAAYLTRPLPIYDEIADNRNDIEFTLSRNSDNIRKNSSPIVKVSGTVIGDAPVGDNAREVYRLENGGDVSLVSPALTTTDAKAHVEMLKEMIEESTQLPNLSMENVKGLGAISGEARKTLLTDAHLKVTEESHDICWFLDREFAVIKSLLCVANPEWKKYEHTTTADQVLTPFIQGDVATDIANYTKASGVLMSQKSAIAQAGLVDDPEAEYERILEEKKAEAEAERISDVFEGAE